MSKQKGGREGERERVVGEEGREGVEGDEEREERREGESCRRGRAEGVEGEGERERRGVISVLV